MSDARLSALLIGDSAPMRKLRALVAKVAYTSIPVLVEGETGTGKELVAQSLHAMSGRSGPLISVNVCAIADTMFEDALFGHAQGAYTGAARASTGFLAEANGGTLFLDEIGSLPLGNQVKLLRAVETREFRPLGSPTNRRSDFRIVTATNESLHGLSEEGKFRWDLMHRLAGVRVRVPALRARLDDMPALVAHLSRTLPESVRKPLTPAALDSLRDYSWPGNVRELRNVIEASSIIAHGDQVERSEVESLLIARQAAKSNQSIAEIDTRYFVVVLDECGWDTALVAARLGVHRATVYRRMQRLGIPLAERLMLTREDSRPVSESFDSRV